MLVIIASGLLIVDQITKFVVTYWILHTSRIGELLLAYSRIRSLSQ